MKRVAAFAVWVCVALCLGGSARAAGAPTPTLKVTTLDGKSFDLAAHRGKWVIVNWWATWCVPCIKELPEISAFVAKHADKVAAIGLAFEDSEKADIVNFLKQRPIAYPVAQVEPFDPPKEFSAPQGLPTTVVIAPDGRVAKSFVGPVTGKDLEAIVAAQS